MSNNSTNTPFQLVVGLGNPGSQYKETRHNAGFLLLDYMTQWSGVQLTANPKFTGLTGKTTRDGNNLHFIKPLSFINNSGESVLKMMSYYKLKPESILVLHDDLDLKVGNIRLKNGGGHGGHNGLRDIHRVIGSNYSRIRIGIGHPGNQNKVLSFVLGTPNQSEKIFLQEGFKAVIENLPSILDGDWEKPMNHLHKHTGLLHGI